MFFKNLPNNMKVKIRLAEMYERQAEDAPKYGPEYELLERADALRAEVEAYVSASTATGFPGVPGTVAEALAEHDAIQGTVYDDGADARGGGPHAELFPNTTSWMYEDR